MAVLKKKVAVTCRTSDSDGSSSKSDRPTIALVARLQTADEQHRFKAATDALLRELVRQQISRREQ